MTFSAVPAAQGLYDPAAEHDACGVAFVVDATGRRSHRLVEQGLTALHNMEHRGAAGSDPASGDGAGLLVQVPDAFLRTVAGVELPEPTAAGEAAYAVGNVFLPLDEEANGQAVALVEHIMGEEGLQVLGWRHLPTDPAGLGAQVA